MNSYTITPTLGDPVIDALILNYRPDWLKPRQFSILSTIAALISDDLPLALVILVFSVLFPLTKITALLTLSFRRTRNVTETPLDIWTKWFLHTFGHWSMLDVLVVAIIVVGFKSLPLGAIVEREFGLAFFGCSVVLGMVASHLYESNEKKGLNRAN